jgi:peptidoglycan/xylan/chitin deacetylase (PgdA/CDA1 family)
MSPLLILNFHQVYVPENPKLWQSFERNIKILAQKYNFVLPGQALLKSELNICLTFDDAYADFYFHIAPLLKNLNIPAVLAVPSAYPLDYTSLDTDLRLAVNYPHGLNRIIAREKSSICTWEELKNLAKEPLIQLAAHGHNHYNFKQEDINEIKILEELEQPKIIFQEKIGIVPKNYIYPFGFYSQTYHELSQKYYNFSMRLGNSLNFGWPKNGLLYRIDGEKFLDKIYFWNFIHWANNYFGNRIRAR